MEYNSEMEILTLGFKDGKVLNLIMGIENVVENEMEEEGEGEAEKMREKNGNNGNLMIKKYFE
jgi:hypothetical protein